MRFYRNAGKALPLGIGLLENLFQRHRGWVLEFMVHPLEVTKIVSALKLLSNLLRVLHSFCVHRSRPPLCLLSNLLSSPSLYFSSLPSSTSLIFSTSLLRFSTLPCSSLLYILFSTHLCSILLFCALLLSTLIYPSLLYSIECPQHRSFSANKRR